MISNIPIGLLFSYPDQDVVVRGSEPGILVTAALQADENRIKRVQLLSPGQGIEALCGLPRSVAIDLCLTELRQADQISKWAELFQDRSASPRDAGPQGAGTRLVVPTIDGFGDVVKQALRANFRVQLEIDQPDEDVVNELEDTFIFFVREPDVTEPVDLFSRLLGSFLTKRVESLWLIQEELPSSFRYITDTGRVTLSKRLSEVMQSPDPTKFLAEHKLNLFLRKDECCTCRFFSFCEGYFKLPVAEYSCSYVKELFGLIWDCAGELTSDLSQVSASSEPDRREAQRKPQC